MTLSHLITTVLLKSNLTPRFIIKTKKWVSNRKIGFGIILLFQGIFPEGTQKGLEYIPEATEIVE